MWPFDLTLHIKSMAQMKCMDANRCHKVAYVRSEMKRPDFAMSHVKKNRRAIASF